MINHWKYDSFKLSVLQGYINQKRIIIPRYQRGVVWNDEKKDTLIDSIKQGFPFGSILLFHEEDKNIYQIIDGLQRCSTIFEFTSNPAKFFNESDIDDDAVERLAQIITNGYGHINGVKSIITKLLIDWVKNKHKSLDDVITMQFYNFVEVLEKQFPDLSDKTSQIIKTIQPMLENYQKICKSISETAVPALVFYGTDDNLPTIFERINSQGAKLNKYQIFSASWTKSSIKISSKRLIPIIDNNIKRYENMESSGIELDNFSPKQYKSDGIINLFELGYGFGRYLKQEYPHLFGKASSISKNQVDSVGFNILNSCLARRVNEMPNLNRNIKEIGDDSQINIFLEKILDTIDYISVRLKPVNIFKSNKRKNINSGPLHTEMQIVTIIASVFISRYITFNLDDDNNIIQRSYNVLSQSEKWKDTLEHNFRENFLRNYVLDILRQLWRGSGDRRTNQIVLYNPTYYSEEVNSTDFEKALDSWYLLDKQSRRESKKVANPKEPEKVLLNLIYSIELNAHDQLDDSKYDFDHICPKKYMKDQIQSFEGEFYLPISSFANICLLPEKYNRSKKDKTIYQNDFSKNEITEIESKYTFTKREDLEWVDLDFATFEEFSLYYDNFLNSRYDVLKSKIIAALYK